MRKVSSGVVQPKHYVGHFLADVVSGIIADQEVDTLLEQDLGKWQAITYMVARRIAIIERKCWDADPTSVPLEDEQPLDEWSNLQHQDHIQEQMKASGHRVVRFGNYVVCTLSLIHI